MTGALDIAPLIVWAAAISTLLSLGTTVWSFLSSGSRTNAKRLGEVSDRMDRHDGRIARIEQTVGGLPAKEDMHSISLAISELKGDLKAIHATMEGNNKIITRIDSIVSRHEDHLMSGPKR